MVAMVGSRCRGQEVLMSSKVQKRSLLATRRHPFFLVSLISYSWVKVAW